MGRGEGRENFANKRTSIAKGREANTKESLGLRNKTGRGGGGADYHSRQMSLPF